MGDSAENPAMQRPVMNPDFFDRDDAPPAQSRLRQMCGIARRIFRWAIRLAFSRPFVRRATPPQGSFLYRLAVGMTYRVAVGSLLVALAAAALLTAATHPRSATAADDPAMQGLYYDPVAFLSTDGVRLDAWLIPELDASRVLRDKDQALRDKQPAVVLVHDYGRSREQMLPLIRPLHEAGFVVLALNLRGCGSSASSPQLFGLREWMDVKAAVEMLQRRPFVDDTRISAVGIGSGANAVLLAAAEGTQIHAMVLQNPIGGFNQAMDRVLLPPALQRDWIHTLLRWTFESMYWADTQQLGQNISSPPSPRRLLKLTEGLPYDSKTITRTCQFLRSADAPHG